MWGVLLDTAWLKFFPAAGNCNNGSVNNVGSNGNYWSSSLNADYGENNAYNMNFNSDNVNWDNNNNRYNGYSVRGVLGEHSSCPLLCHKFVTYDNFYFIMVYVFINKDKVIV